MLLSETESNSDKSVNGELLVTLPGVGDLTHTEKFIRRNLGDPMQSR